MDSSRRYLRVSLRLGALFFLGVYATAVGLRIGYPYGLEWLEGGSLIHVMRILGGQKLYVAPSLDFIPYIYAPLYYYVSAVVSAATGVGLVPLRLVSVAASIGAFFLIYRFVVKETGDRFAGLLSAGLFAACYEVTGAWYDTAKTDSLFIFLQLCSLYLIRFGRTSRASLIAGVLVALSYFTKQTALVATVPVVLYCFYVNRRRAFIFTATAIALIGFGTVLLDYAHGGWYSYYTYGLIRQHKISTDAILTFWTRSLMGTMPIAALAGLFYFFDQLAEKSWERCLFYSLMLAGLIGGAYGSSLNWGGTSNARIPAYAALAIVFGLGLHAALRQTERASEPRPKLMEVFVYLACASQFFMLVYNPLAYLPTAEDVRTGNAFVKYTAELKGDVYLPYSPYLATLAGKTDYAHAMMIHDVFVNDRTSVRRDMIREIKGAITDKRFDAIIGNNSWWERDFRSVLDTHYERHELPIVQSKGFWPMSGNRTRPHSIYLPRTDISD